MGEPKTYRNKLLVRGQLFEPGMEDGVTCQPKKARIVGCPGKPTKICSAGCPNAFPFIQTSIGPTPVEKGYHVVDAPGGVRFVLSDPDFQKMYEEVPEEEV